MAWGSHRKEPTQPDPDWVIFGVSGGSCRVGEVLPAGPGSVQAPGRHDWSLNLHLSHWLLHLSSLPGAMFCYSLGSYIPFTTVAGKIYELLRA